MEIAALLDCGETYNSISSRPIELILLWLSTGPSLMVTMANTLVVLTDKYVTVPLRFGPSSRLISFLVLPNVSTPTILGMQFLEAVNLMVDWVNTSVMWTDNSQ